MATINKIEQVGNTIQVHLDDGTCENFPAEAVSNNADLLSKLQQRFSAREVTKVASASKVATMKSLENTEV